MMCVCCALFRTDDISASAMAMNMTALLPGVMKALKCGTLGASFGKPCASGYVEGILDEYIHSIVYIRICL